MILVDANVLMYAAGAPHPHKRASLDLLRRIAGGHMDAAVDAETLQEILHRYRAMNRWEDGRKLYDLTRTTFAVVIPITAEILDDARVLLDKHTTLMARDALHAAACRKAGARAICSFDKDFDVIRELKRIEPAQVR